MKAQLNPSGRVINRCPCGCPDDMLDEWGYCHHLLGFTNDGKTFERIGPPDDRGNRNVIGHKKEKVERSYILVNPESIDPAGQVNKLWVSARVYDRSAKPAKMVDPEEEDGDEDSDDEILEPTAKAS